jgi:hypothetical protein
MYNAFKKTLKLTDQSLFRPRTGKILVFIQEIADAMNTIL